jgi:tetratricopeptide (TPR) repeat protein
MSQLYLKQGKLADALREIDEVKNLNPENVIHHRIRGHIHHINDEWEAAEREYQFLVEHDDRNQQLRGRLWKSRLLLAQGKLQKSREEAISGAADSHEYELQAYEQDFLLLLAYLNLRLKAFDEAAQAAGQAYAIASELLVFDRMRFAILLKGLAFLEAGETALAEETAMELRTQIESSACLNFMRNYYLLMGFITIQKGEPALALDYLEMAYNSLPHQKSEYDNHVLYLGALAEAAEMAGETDKTQTYLESLLSLTTGKLQWGDIYVLGYYSLGKIYQNKGMQDRAIEQYQEFLELWKDADYGQAQRQDAEKQLGSLRNSAGHNLSE